MVLFAPIFSMGPAVCAQENSQTIAVRAVVEPHIYLVVNDSGQITQVFNNSHWESEPSVLVGSLSGPVGQLSPTTANQYTTLKPLLDFSKYGVLYQKPNPDYLNRAVISSLVKNVLLKIVTANY